MPPITNYITVVNALIVSPDSNKVLMAFRPPDKKKPLLWEYPGGKVEPGESLQEALKRELKEELDIDARIEGRISKATLHMVSEEELYLFVVTSFFGEPKPLVATELRWVEPEYAVDHLPCLPFVYLAYRDVIRTLDSMSLARDRADV